MTSATHDPVRPKAPHRRRIVRSDSERISKIRAPAGSSYPSRIQKGDEYFVRSLARRSQPRMDETNMTSQGIAGIGKCCETAVPCMTHQPRLRIRIRIRQDARLVYSRMMLESAPTYVFLRVCLVSRKDIRPR